MAEIRDCWGKAVRLTSERLAHILEHPEMKPLGEEAVRAVLREPEEVRLSASDPRCRLYYQLRRGTAVGDKHLCVVVKTSDRDAFVVTAYLTDRPRKGEPLWPER